MTGETKKKGPQLTDSQSKKYNELTALIHNINDWCSFQLCTNVISGGINDLCFARCNTCSLISIFPLFNVSVYPFILEERKDRKYVKTLIEQHRYISLIREAIRIQN